MKKLLSLLIPGFLLLVSFEIVAEAQTFTVVVDKPVNGSVKLEPAMQVSLRISNICALPLLYGMA